MTGPAAARAGVVQIQQRDIDGLVLCGEHGGAPYDLLGAALGAQPARLRGITARWRRAGYAATGQIGPGPAWCWLTPAGMAATGLGYPPGPPRLARLAHARAVLAARLWLQAAPDWEQGRPWWQSERRFRRRGPASPAGHRPDAEIHWPSLTPSPHAGQVWAVEMELTPKPAARTTAIMGALAGPAGYARTLYLTAPAARPLVTRCARDLPPGAPGRIDVIGLPPGAWPPGESAREASRRRHSTAPLERTIIIRWRMEDRPLTRENTIVIRLQKWSARALSAITSVKGKGRKG
jgi:hypothetical protein